MTFPAYQDYRQCELSWLNKVPSHWKYTSVKREAPFQVGWTPSTGNNENFVGENLWANISDLKAKVITSTQKRISDQAALEASMDITPKGSLLYSFKLSVGLMSFAGTDLYTNEAIASFLPNEKNDLKFLYYAFGKFIIKNATENIYGAKILNQELIKNAPLILPPLGEQKAIARFLDCETAKIDRLIEKQERLIELLKEKRQAVISHAVTKGLNPDAKMKDSGVEWLGEVPEHWAVKKFSHCANIRNGQVDPRVPPYSQMVLFAPNHIEKATGRILFTETAEQQGADSGKYLCKKGEVLYSKIRPALAKAAICPESTALCSADMYPISAANGLSNQYLLWLILSDGYTSMVTLDSDRVAMPKVNRDTLDLYKIPVPPLAEQKAISTHINYTTCRIDALIEKSNSSIELMRERRSALISAAVTGKIDVRNWQPETTCAEAEKIAV